MTSWDMLSKFILVGDPSTGKSSLLVQLTDQRFLADPDPTVGVEFGSYIVDVPETGERIKCQCWDTAGSETFRSITRSYYRGAAGALLVYSITHRPSFDHIADWLRDVREHAEENVSIILVGNMSDLCAAEDAEEQQTEEQGQEQETASRDRQDEQEGSNAQRSEDADTTPSPKKSRARRRRRQVTRLEAEEFAKRENIMFVETSAKTGQNVEEAFRRAAHDIYSKHQATLSSQGASARSGLVSSSGQGRPGIISAAASGQEQNSSACCVIS